MASKKIIHIKTGRAGHNPGIPDFESRHYGTWATPFAVKTLEYTDKYDMEIWSYYDPEVYGNRGISTRRRYNVTFRLFPARKIFSGFASFVLLSELRKMIEKKTEILVHLHGAHRLMHHLVALQCRHIPVVLTQRGGAPPIEMFRLVEKKIYYLALQLLEMITFSKCINITFSGSIGESIFIKSHYGQNKVISERGGGWDFNNPLYQHSKNEIRKELNLSEKSKILIHVGRFVDHKGLPVIIQAYQKLKKEDNDFKLLLIGGHKSHPLYNQVMNSGAIVKGRLPHHEVIKYIRASDVYLMLLNRKKSLLYGGLGTAVIESTSLGTPVVSSSLIHFNGNQSERESLGVVPDISFLPANVADVVRCVKYVTNNPKNFSDIIRISRKYFSWEAVLDTYLKKYEELFSIYYGERENITPQG